MAKDPELLVLVGLPASGKSTLAAGLVRDHNYVRINWDDMRHAMHAQQRKWSKTDEDNMQSASRTLAIDALKAGNPVVIDNTNLTPHRRASWKALGDAVGVRTRFHYMDTKVDVCVARDRKRTGLARVGRAVIENMALANGYLSFPQSAELVIFDVDGTLANCDHRQHYLKGPGKKDWLGFFANVDADVPVEVVVKWANACYDAGMTVLVISGRPTNLCGVATEEWLERAGVKYHHLFMRSIGDSRPDIEAKKDILDRLPIEQIKFCVDDRPSVCRMWKENGLTVYPVDTEEF